MPLDNAWLHGNAAFHSGDAKLVRAVLNMLQCAWFSDSPGSLPASRQELSDAIGLTEQELLQHYDVLTVGWELNGDGRLTYEPLQRLALEVIEIHGKDLLRLRARSVAAVAAPDQFDLLPRTTTKALGKTKLPAEFEPSPQTINKLIDEGFTTEKRREWIQEKFCNHYRATGDKLVDWQAAFLNFAKKERAYDRPWNQANSHWTEPGHTAPLQRPNTPFAQQKAAVRNTNEAIFGLAPAGEPAAVYPSAPRGGFGSAIDQAATVASFRESPRS